MELIISLDKIRSEKREKYEQLFDDLESELKCTGHILKTASSSFSDCMLAFDNLKKSIDIF